MVPLSPEESIRYGRHVILPEIGVEGQLRLKNASVLLVGLGGLGSPAAMYLAAAGVGRIGVLDFDTVDLSNLHRQIVHSTESVGEAKTLSAAETIRSINPNVQVEQHHVRLNAENALGIFAQYDLVLDGADNFPTRYLVNDACVLLKKPNVYGSIYRFEGQATVFCVEGGPCYRCLFPQPPPAGSVPSCAEAGVLGVLPGTIGLIQATEAVKIVLGIGRSLVGRLVMYDALEMSFQEVAIHRDPDCPICGPNPTLKKLMENETALIREIDCDGLVELMEGPEPISIIDVREPYELAIGFIEGSSLIPLGELPKRTDELERDKLTVFYCRAGVRSLAACQIAQDAGYTNVISLSGGILSWLER